MTKAIVRLIARKAGPETSRLAAKKIITVNAKDIIKALKLLGPSTCMEVINHYQEEYGIKLQVDPISSRFNRLAMKGILCTTGTTRKNVNSKRDAMIWRFTTPEEKKFIKKYVGKNVNTAWTSADELMMVAAVQNVLKTHPNKKIRAKYKNYCKGFLWKTKFKDLGVIKFMEMYDEEGIKRDTFRTNRQHKKRKRLAT